MKREDITKANNIINDIKFFDEFIEKADKSSVIGARYSIGNGWKYANIRLEEKTLKEVFGIVKRERDRLEDELKRM